LPVSPAPDQPNACAQEPIHIPGSIQPHGWLLAFGCDGVVSHASENLDSLLGRPAPGVLGAALADILPWQSESGGVLARDVMGWARQSAGGFARRARLQDALYQCFAHRADGAMILEIEPVAPASQNAADSLQADVLEFSRAAEDLADWRGLAQAAARTARRISAFERVLIYRFDADWNGCVVAEDRSGEGDGALPSYLGQYFPASDIPAQARALYLRNRLRLIPDACYTPVRIVPECGPGAVAALDLRQAALRSVSPLHLQYMRNMGTRASMSASLIVEGRLWGLIAFHSRAPHFAGLPVRSAVEFLAQILASGIAARQHSAQARLLTVAGVHHDRLLAAMAARSPPGPEILAEEADDLLALTGAAGAAVVSEHDCISIGQTPDIAEIRAIAAWLGAQGERGVYATDQLGEHFPAGAALAGSASGVLAISISELHPSYVMWFRPEVVQTLDWAGAPEKPGDATGDLTPRQSFDLWRQTVHQRALPWAPHEIEAARRLRLAIVGVVLRRAEELAGVNRELARSNKELEAFSYSISHDLRAPFRHIVGYAELLREHQGATLTGSGARYLQTIIDSALSAGQLVDDLLHFSRLGRAQIVPAWVNMAKLVDETRRSLEIEQAGRAIDWRVGELPQAWGDQALLRQVVLNLLSNAIKYSKGQTPAVIEISGEMLEGASRYTVGDNGAGFDMAYAGKLFGVFQRLHRAEEYEGTGIGLALARRIVERHGGTISAQGEVGHGARFSFVLPHPGQAAEAAYLTPGIISGKAE
jgi:light-regulated signal transduction histidine kinase (bacteriophytochrome)